MPPRKFPLVFRGLVVGFGGELVFRGLVVGFGGELVFNIHILWGGEGEELPPPPPPPLREHLA